MSLDVYSTAAYLLIIAAATVAFFSLIFLLHFKISVQYYKRPPLIRVRGPGTMEDDHAPPDGRGRLGF
jgi:hypothetical protein